MALGVVALFGPGRRDCPGVPWRPPLLTPPPDNEKVGRDSSPQKFGSAHGSSPSRIDPEEGRGNRWSIYPGVPIDETSEQEQTGQDLSPRT